MNEVLENAVRPNMRYVSARAVEHYLRARLALGDGHTESAAAELSMSAVYDPQSAWPRYAMARDKFERGHKSEAGTDVRIALQMDDEHVPSLLLRAQLLIDEGDLDRAVQMLSKVFTLAEEGSLSLPDVHDAVASTSLALAQSLVRAQRDEEADLFFQRSLSTAPRTLARMDAYVAFLESHKRVMEAASLAEQTLAYTTPDVLRVLRTARLHLAAKRSDVAVAYVPLLASISSADDAALVELGALLLKEREPSRALVAFEAALALAPENRDARGYEALALEVLGQLAPAIQSYQQVFTDEIVGEWARARAASCEKRLAAEAILMGTQVAESMRSVQTSTAETAGATLSP